MKGSSIPAIPETLWSRLDFLKKINNGCVESELLLCKFTFEWLAGRHDKSLPLSITAIFLPDLF